MSKRYFAFAPVLITILFFTLGAGTAAEKISYEYGELVVIHRTSGKLKSSTTIYFFYGDGREIRSHKSENDPRGLTSRREAFEEFIEQYTQQEKTPTEPSIMAVLNTLGSDGWELIQFKGVPGKCKENSTPQSTYLFKRRN